MKSNAEDPLSSSPLSENNFPLNIVLAVLLAPLSCLFIVLCFTSGVDFIYNIDLILRAEFPFFELNTKSHNRIIWPLALYIGGIIGGIIGGLIAYWEIRIELDKNNSLKPVQLFSPDLFYLGLLMILTYVLEMLSESVILQGLLFTLEVAWFAVIGRNISKRIVNISETSKDSDIPESES